MERNIELNLLESKSGDEGYLAFVPENSTTISFAKVESIDYGSIEFYYDRTKGILSIATDYGTVEIEGFLTESSIGTGKMGKRGKRGADGKNGVDGREGKQGKTGCEGIPGEDGEDGDAGDEGEDGLDGQVGNFGCPGPRGIDGNMGAMGPDGPDGARGPAGPACIFGPTGPTGPTPYSYVVISEELPTDPLVYIWAQSVAPDTVPVEPVKPSLVVGSINSVVVQLVASSGSYYQGIAAFTATFNGGVGPFKYEWTGTFDTDPEVYVYETGNTSKNMNLQCRKSIPSGTTIKVQGQVKVVVTDLGNNGATAYFEGSYTFNGTNASTGGGGSGGGCFIYGSKVMLGNTERLIQEVYEGDVIVGLDVQGLPDSSSGKDDFLKWSTDNLNATNTDVEIVKSYHNSFSYYYLINDILGATVEEKLLVRRGTEWSFIMVRDIVVGDYLHHITGVPKRVDSIVRIDKSCSTVSLNVETVDTYYVDGYLVHNIDSNYAVIKN